MCDSSLIDAIVGPQGTVEPIVVIAAHPDDEIIGMGSRLNRIRELTLVYATNGAPANMRRAQLLGFASVESYSHARFGELKEGLSLLGAKVTRQVTLDLPDGETVFHLSELVDRIATAIRGAAAVVTHPYEGGHPDHDTCAFGTRLACARIAASGGVAPQHLEFACYHGRGGQLTINDFWPDPNCPQSIVLLTWWERWRKRRAMRAFRTQSFLVGNFRPTRESYRAAPAYDFQLPPPTGEWFYDRYGWPLKGEAWLGLVREFSSATKLLRGADQNTITAGD